MLLKIALFSLISISTIFASIYQIDIGDSFRTKLSNCITKFQTDYNERTYNKLSKQYTTKGTSKPQKEKIYEELDKRIELVNSGPIKIKKNCVLYSELDDKGFLSFKESSENNTFYQFYGSYQNHHHKRTGRFSGIRFKISREDIFNRYICIKTIAYKDGAKNFRSYENIVNISELDPSDAKVLKREVRNVIGIFNINRTKR